MTKRLAFKEVNQKPTMILKEWHCPQKLHTCPNNYLNDWVLKRYSGLQTPKSRKQKLSIPKNLPFDVIKEYNRLFQRLEARGLENKGLGRSS